MIALDNVLVRYLRKIEGVLIVLREEHRVLAGDASVASRSDVLVYVR